jgi:hypothetical protein
MKTTWTREEKEALDKFHERYALEKFAREDRLLDKHDIIAALLFPIITFTMITLMFLF